jgi:hypothetical protein
VASAGADSTVKFWRINDDIGIVTSRRHVHVHVHVSLVCNLVTCVHSLDLKTGFGITLELMPLDEHPDGEYRVRLVSSVNERDTFFAVFLLFVATDKNQVHVYQVTNAMVSNRKSQR